MVEADGEWHTADNQYASASWKATHSPEVPPPPAPAPQTASPVQPVVNGSQTNGSRKESDVEILVLDSDEDDDEKPEPSPSYASSSRTSFDAREPTQPLPQLPQLQPRRNKIVIDLTLDDSDEDQLPAFGKRKASDANLASSLPDQLWKKGRIDPSRILPTPRLSSSINLGIRPVPNPPSPNRYPSFPNNTLPPVYQRYRSNSATGGDSPVHLPPISTTFSRQPTSSHHHAWP